MTHIKNKKIHLAIERFIEYVNEMRDLGITIPITEESYKEYIEYVRTEPSNDTVDRGSR